MQADPTRYGFARLAVGPCFTCSIASPVERVNAKMSAASYFFIL